MAGGSPSHHGFQYPTKIQRLGWKAPFSMGEKMELMKPWIFFGASPFWDNPIAAMGEKKWVFFHDEQEAKCLKCVAVMKYPTEMVSLLWFHIPFLQKKKPQLGLFTSRRAEPDAKTTSWQVPGTNIEVVLLATSVTCHCTRPSRAYWRTG